MNLHVFSLCECRSQLHKPEWQYMIILRGFAILVVVEECEKRMIIILADKIIGQKIIGAHMSMTKRVDFPGGC